MTDMLVDSNVFVYAFDKSAGEKHLIAEEIMEELRKTKSACTGIQNIAEFSRVVTEKLPVKMPFEETQKQAFRIKKSFKILYYNIEAIADALSIVKFYKVHFFDALIVATMKQNQLDTIITANEDDFRKIPGIKVINPFKRRI